MELQLLAKEVPSPLSYLSGSFTICQVEKRKIIKTTVSRPHTVRFKSQWAARTPSAAGIKKANSIHYFSQGLSQTFFPVSSPVTLEPCP